MLYAQAYGRVLEWEAERCKEPEEFLSLLQLGVDRLGLKREPEAGFESVRLPLVTGLVCKVHIPQSPQARMRWIAIAENLVPALNRATERWGALPGLNFATTQPEAGPALSSTNKTPSN
jgi:UDP-GlcNAc:undecaprenyl-phosphate GlcNAc-1-phosphate transferase